MKRRRQGKTDYKARLAMLKSGKARVVFRKTNKYIIGQLVRSEKAQDKVVTEVNSKKLLDYGWPQEAKNSLKSLPASYLTGYLLGKNIEEEVIFDMGMNRNVPKSRAYAFLKGLVDRGVKINLDEGKFPDEKRLEGEHLKNNIDFDKIKQKIEG